MFLDLEQESKGDGQDPGCGYQSLMGGDADKWPRLYSVSKSRERVSIEQKLNQTGQEDGLHEKRYVLNIHNLLVD